MSKYDKEREAMGFSPVASSSSTGKSKYDSERYMYKRGDENKQYADSMKSAYESNPDSFTNPTNASRVERAGLGDLNVPHGEYGFDRAINVFENLPVVKNIGGALSGAYNNIASSPLASFSQWGSQAKKNLGSLLTGNSGNAPLQQGLQSIVEGAMNPDAAKEQMAQNMQSSTVGLGPISKAVTNTLAQFGTDPLSLIPVAGAGRLSRVSTSGDLLKATPKGATVRPFVPPVEEVAGPTLGLPNGMGEASQWPRTFNSSEPIVNPHTFELPQASEATMNHNQNISDAFNAMNDIDTHVGALDSKYQQAINDQYQYLKSTVNAKRGGEKGNFVKDPVSGKVISRYGSISSKPIWVQKALKDLNVKNLNNKQLYELAKKHVDEGFHDDGGFVPSWLENNDYHNTKQTLGAVKDEIRNSIKQNGLNITDANLKSQELSFNKKGPTKAEQQVENISPEQPKSAEPQLQREPVAQVAPKVTAAPAKPVASAPVKTQKQLDKDYEIAKNSSNDYYKQMKKKYKGNYDLMTPEEVAMNQKLGEAQFAAERARDHGPTTSIPTNNPETLKTESPKQLPNQQTNLEDAVQHAEPRVSDKVVNFFDEVEQAAKDRIAASKGRMNSLPVDLLADYAIIGASKLAKGLVKGSVRFSDWSAEMIKDFGEEIKPHLKDIFTKSKEHVKDAERQASGVAHLPGVNSGIDPLKGNKANIASLEKALGNSKEWKDKGRILLNRETTERNFEDIMGKDAPIMKKTYIEPIHEAAADRQRFITKERNDIKDLGIKYKSADDALVQKYGEGKMSLDELKAESPENWQKVKTAAETMRAKYDKLLDQANEVLRRNSYPEVPKRKDYFPHYEEVDGLLNKLGFGFEDHTLPAEMNGVTANLKPGKNFFSNFQKRKGTETTLGAVAGFDRYIEGISKVIYQTDNIKRLRGLDKTLRETHEGTTHLSDFVANLTDYTNILAGKKSELDRSLEAGVGRNLYSAIDWMKRRVGANMIGGSVSSALTNSIPVSQLVAQTNKASVVKGLNSALQNLKGNDMIGQESNFLARRFPSDKLAMGKLDKAQNVAGSLFKAVDHFTSNLVIRSKYYEGLKEGMSSEAAMEAADKFASRMMAERSEGAMPTLFNSRTFGILTQFQLEVNNQISHLFKDMPRSMSKGKYASALAQVFIYDYIYNELYEKITGNRPAFDPIGVIKNAVEDYSNPRLGNKATENLVRNVSNNVPFLSIYTGGGRVPLSSAFPNVLGVAKGEAKLGNELLKPVKNLALPFGGGQVYKTITGFNAAKDGGVRSTNADGEDIVKYPISSKASNMVLGSLFGKNALPETRDYYRNNNPSLTANETRMLDNAPNKEQMYKDILKNKELNSLKDKMTKISKDRSLTEKERTKKLGSLTDQYKEITTGVR